MILILGTQNSRLQTLDARLQMVAESFLPTRFGRFRIYAFAEGDKDHIALVSCGHKMHDDVPVRVHSKCFTGDTLCSLRCDCRGQLEEALRYLKKKRCGILIYLDQEGRGIGLSNKIKAYALQDKGMDTVEANTHLGFHDDLREYSVAAEILKHFGVRNVALLTNNPKKVEGLEKHGVKVAKIFPIVTKTNKYNRKYLETKARKMNHFIKIESGMAVK